MWDRGAIEDDGYVHRYMNQTNRKVPQFPSSSCVSNAKSMSTPVKIKSTTIMHKNLAASPVTLDPSMFLTPKKRVIYSKSPELIRICPRLVSKAIAAVSGGSGSMNGKKLFVNLDVDEVECGEGEIPDKTRMDELEYVNIQLENNDEDVCHPFDDCRSPVSDTEEMVIGVYMNFVNNYFWGEKSFDYLHPQQYKKAVEAQAKEGSTDIMEYDPRGKAVVVDEESEG
ncbi:uncharacterized protein LOC113275761 [Papaver somniferum]|uniref:uncharacterized protein LOC113275761 n=1 Tax=Papaver somniferum TaxID=3469 RepID=UPI000E7047B0|nr:uncharacterized protein LOC113275761 [Papaver somniferum]XP_026381111.1 uncharacterized protein LOC113275761 [Papaver somniferum]